MEAQILEKWKDLIDAAKKYWIDSVPTGLSDDYFNQLEIQARVEDGFYVRDYIFDTYLKGTKTMNRDIDKIKKEKVQGQTILSAMEDYAKENGIPEDELYCDLKYDGSSIAIYLDPNTGKPQRLVTVGNLNLNNYGVDQTWKLMKLIPEYFPRGIKTIQAEALIDTERLSEADPERARQKANGLINSKYCDDEVSSLLTLRAYRYYTSDDVIGQTLASSDYRKILYSFQVKKSMVDGHITFAPAQVWSLKELKTMTPGYTETDRTVTGTGTFLNDGWVLYDKRGTCIKALKFAGAGSGSESIKTTVRGIQWNDQNPKGKDSWSANVIVDPITIKGCTIKKPSAGSVSKLIKNNITPGAEVGIILANSTIPMVGEVFKAGNGDYQMPKCECGYQMTDKDIYGSLLKCGNPSCSVRLKRMKDYLSSLDSPADIDLNKLLVIDRFKWGSTDLDLGKLYGFVKGNQKEEYRDYLLGYMKTDLQKKNMNLVWEASWNALVWRMANDSN